MAADQSSKKGKNNLPLIKMVKGRYRWEHNHPPPSGYKKVCRSSQTLSTMLLVSMLSLSITGVTALGSISPPIIVRQTTDPCTSECAIPLSVVANCSTSPDPFCGCGQFVPAAGPCKTCLAQSNSTIGGVVNAVFVAEAVVLCNCQSPSCGDLILSSRQCQATDPTNANCTCPAIVRDTDCYTCMEANDSSIADILRGDVSHCQAILSEISPSSAPSSKASATPSNSGLPTFTSDGGMIVTVEKSLLWFSVTVVVGYLVCGIF
jgi:hypothetical protein